MGMKPRKNPIKLSQSKSWVNQMIKARAERKVDEAYGDAEERLRHSSISAPTFPDVTPRHPLLEKLSWENIRRRLRLLKKPNALPMRAFGAKEGDYTWEDWQEETKKKYPVRYFLQETLTMWFRVRIKMRLNDFWWGIKYRTTHRYHKLDISNKKNHYLIGYRDSDTQILFASMAILVSFVEKEMSYSDWTWNEAHQETSDEIMTIYKWWTEERPAQHDDPEAYKHENGLYKKDNEMLVRLIEIREYLWT